MIGLRPIVHLTSHSGSYKFSSLSSLCFPSKMDFNSRNNFLDKLKIPNTRTKSYVDRAFTVALSKEWNKLSLELKKSSSVQTFKTKKILIHTKYYIINCLNLYLFIMHCK